MIAGQPQRKDNPESRSPCSCPIEEIPWFYTYACTFVSVGWSVVPCMLQWARVDSGERARVRAVLTERSTEQREQRLESEGGGISTLERVEGEGLQEVPCGWLRLQ